MTDGTFEKIDEFKTTMVLSLLRQIAEGPREAYAILVTSIYRLNFEINDTPGSIDELCSEVASTLRSITKVHNAAN